MKQLLLNWNGRKKDQKKILAQFLNKIVSARIVEEREALAIDVKAAREEVAHLAAERCE